MKYTITSSPATEPITVDIDRLRIEARLTGGTTIHLFGGVDRRHAVIASLNYSHTPEPIVWAWWLDMLIILDIVSRADPESQTVYGDCEVTILHEPGEGTSIIIGGIRGGFATETHFLTDKEPAKNE